MALGTVKASGGLQTQLVSGNAGQIGADAVSGLGDAVNRLAQAGMGYLNSRTDIEVIYDKRAQASKGLELDTQFLEYQNARAMEFTEFSRGRSDTPAGLTKDYDAMLAQQETEFLKTVPPRFQEEMKAKLAQDRAMRVGSAFTSELSLLDTVDTNNLNKGLNTLGSGLKGGKVSLEDAEATWSDMVLKSALPDETKNQFIESGKATLQGLEFGTIVEQSAAGYGSVSDDASGQDVSAAGLMPQERGVLNAIASRESPGYNIWNGGSSFEGYEDHPAATSKAPGKSTAAGRYQFILGTWRAASASYEKTYGVKVPNFSPEWQDRVALHWAESIFNKWNTEGLTFKQVMASGDPAQIAKVRRVLGNPKDPRDPTSVEWQGWSDTSFGGNSAAADAAFIEVVTGQKGFAGGGTGPATGPNVWTDERFSSLSLDSKMGFANAAAAAAEQQKQAMATQLQMERDSFLDQAYNAGYANQPGVLEALQGSRYWDAEAQSRYNSGQEVFRNSENEVANVGAALAAGTPLASDAKAAFGKWFGEESFAGVAAGDQEALAKMGWAVDRARVFPEGSVDAFLQAMGNPNTQAGALAFLASAHAGDSSILKRSGFSQDTIADVQLYKNIAERESSSEKAAEKYRLATDASARTGKSATQLTTEASKLFSEKFATSDDLIGTFETTLGPSIAPFKNDTTAGQFMLDASAAFNDGYKVYGTEEGAEAYMQSSLTNLWGVSKVSKPAGLFTWGQEGVEHSLMRHPPEKYYPAADNDFGYLYEAISGFAVANGAQAAGATLLPDEQTDREVREGKPPTYRVIGMGEYGEAVVLPGRFGGAELEAGAVAKIEEDAVVANSMGYIDNYTHEVADLRTMLENEKAYSAQQEIMTGMPQDNPRIAELEASLQDTENKRNAAVLAAVEQGHIAPEALDSNRDVAATVVDLSEGLAARLAEDEVLSKRIAQAMSGGKEPEKVLAKIIAKELKVPASIAELIVLQLNEME